MAYDPPGVTVVEELATATATPVDVPQVLSILGPLYEMFAGRVHTQHYDAVTGAGAQVFAWPGKKATSVVDLAGIRATLAEPDSQLLEGAEYPLAISLRDPKTSQVFALDLIKDVGAVTQAGFTIGQAAAASVAKSSGGTATAGVANHVHMRAGGLINAKVGVGDRVRVTNSPNTPTFDVIGTVTGFADDDVTYVADGTVMAIKTAVNAAAVSIVATVTGTPRTMPSSGKVLVGSGNDRELLPYTSLSVSGHDYTFTVPATAFAHAAGVALVVQIADDADIVGVDGNLTTTPGSLVSAASNLTGDTGARVSIWVEQSQVNTGVSVGTRHVTTGDLTIDATYVGRKVTVWTQQSTAGDGDANASAGQLSSAGASFAAGDLGKVIKIGSAYRRVSAIVSSTVVGYDGTPVTGTTLTYVLYTPNVRTITAVDASGTDFYVDSTVVSGTALPVVIHRQVLRNLQSVTNSTTAVYDGSAISSDTGHTRFVPFELYQEAATYEVFPSYDVLVTYRALDVSNAGNILTIYSAADLAAIGVVSVKNPLLWAAQTALVAMGTTDMPIELVPVDLWASDTTKSGLPEEQDEAAGYLAALEGISSDVPAYALVPLSRNTTVRDACVAHVNAQSLPHEKRERSCFLTFDLPLGRVESNIGTIAPGFNGGNKVITEPGAGFVTTYGLVPGKKVVVTKPAAFAGTYEVTSGSDDDTLALLGANWPQTPEFSVANADTTTTNRVDTATTGVWEDVEAGDYLIASGQTRRITSVTSSGGGAYTRLIYAGSALPSGTGQTVAILRSASGVSYYVDPLTKTAQAAALAAISHSRGNRRVLHIWPDQFEQVTGTDDNGNPVKSFVPSYFAAAAEAGRDMVLKPARSSTGMALGGFTGLKHVLGYFGTAELNVIAGGGWTIFEQATAGAPVKVRHLLTTDMSTKKTQEYSFTKNIDNMAKVKRATLEPLLNDDNGRINITQEVLTNLTLPIQGIYEKFVKNEQIVRSAGKDPYRILSLVQDTVEPDDILEIVELNAPYPANRATVTFLI